MSGSPKASVMIQGTTSNAGKSVAVTGLCRLFRNRGFSVAPFKPQNMALNSAVTVDGGEIGRSQAVQAQACGVEPHTDMNPILLKPNSDCGAQVIINGQATGNMDAVEYHAFKSEAIGYALDAYRRLSSRHDIIVIEGAGSPAEINLRENDVANMGFALEAGCPVLLVADIDRGGVFAHITGTMDCLSKEERALVRGFLINRFRGDKSLLTSGIQWLTDKTSIKTLGVLPYLKGLHIEAEDAVDHRSWGQLDGSESQLKVVVPRIPRISNHTDFDVLRLHPAVELQFVEEGEPMPAADLIVLPGSKSTIGDMDWLERNGWPDRIRRHLRYGGKLIGICGGLQMIGRVIHDRHGLEGSSGSRPGLGLMDFETSLEPAKTLKRARGILFDNMSPVEGYEIHMGDTHGLEQYSAAAMLDGRRDGGLSEDGQILCTYLHGVFDLPEACDAILGWAGLEDSNAVDYAMLKEREIDRVAAMLDEEVGFQAIADAIGISS